MKKYNLSQIMKDAHRLYNNKFQRKGRTWGECVKAAWMWEKDAVKVRAEKEAKKQAAIEASWAAHNERVNQPAQPENLTWSNCYNSNSRGYMNSQYCGD
ncbi:hypothetical protein [Bacteroides congonensis]|uniref:hypothetical protein n=1 Tax=Bacteroides congonensis TaxID=1871006 RepID=UPI0025A44999|nr:hypothetical protein [Bacteroides congonensis]